VSFFLSLHSTLKKQLSTKATKNTKKFKGPHAASEHPMGESPIQCNLLFYFVPFVDELPFLGSITSFARLELSRFHLLHAHFRRSLRPENFVD